MPKQPNLWPVQDMDHPMIDILGSDWDLKSTERYKDLLGMEANFRASLPQSPPNSVVKRFVTKETGGPDLSHILLN